jgi:hypothetical protein
VELKMVFNNQHWRPITFQGMTFPASLMGISILAPILDTTDPELAEWLWCFPVCCGLGQNAPAQVCARCACRCVDLMTENRQQVLDAIRNRLSTCGFDPECTYREWMSALERIADISANVVGDCSWFAPLHPGDPRQSAADMQRFVEYFENIFAHSKVA